MTSMFSVFGQLVAAYWLADLAASLYHLATDAGLNTRRIVDDFQKHHARPETMTFDLQPALGGVPLVMIGVYSGSVFVAAFGTILSLAQVPHYFTHHPAPRIVRTLQAWGLILPPTSHASHHDGRFNRDFAVINGWSNPLVNWCLERAGK